MEQNNITPTLDINSPTQVVPSLAEPPKKPFPWLVLLSFITFAGISVYLFLQNQQLRNQLALVTSSPSPFPAPSASTDPTAGWVIEDAGGYSYKHPKEWKVTIEKGTNQIAMRKELRKEDINFEKCDASNDCIPEASIILSFKNIEEKTDKPCSLFGECLLAKKVATVQNGQTTIQMEFLRNDSIYPIFSYIISPTEIIRAKSYLPTFTNCMGQCPEGTDSPVIVGVGQEIVQILSTFKFTN